MCAFTVSLPGAVETQLQQNKAIIEVLTRLSPSVRHVTIVLYEADVDIGEMATLQSCYDWNQINSILSGISSQLHAVTFRVCDCGDDSSRFAHYRNFVSGKTAAIQRKINVSIVEQENKPRSVGIVFK